MMRKTWQRILRVFLLLYSITPLLRHPITPLLLTVGCSDEPQACRYEDLKPGMTVDDLREIMGAPLVFTEKETGDTWFYECGGGRMRRGGKDITVDVDLDGNIVSVHVFHHGGRIEKIF